MLVIIKPSKSKNDKKCLWIVTAAVIHIGFNDFLNYFFLTWKKQTIYKYTQMDVHKCKYVFLRKIFFSAVEKIESLTLFGLSSL